MLTFFNSIRIESERDATVSSSTGAKAEIGKQKIYLGYNTGRKDFVATRMFEDGKITILPALPCSWESGKVKGLLAVGGVEVDIAWKNRKPISISLRSSLDQSINIFYGNKKLTEKIELKKQEQQIIDLHSCEWI